MNNLSESEGLCEITSLVRALGDPDASVRQVAAEKLWHLGEGAKPAAPALIEALEEDADSGVRWRAAEALRSILLSRTADVIALRKALRDDSYYVRVHALHAFQDFVSEKEVVAALIEALRRGQNPQIKVHAAKELGKLGQEAEEAVPFLCNVLKSETDVELRSQTVAVLRKIGRSTPKAVTVLTSCLRDRNRSVRGQAGLLLVKWDHMSSEALNALRDGLATSECWADIWSSFYGNVARQPHRWESFLFTLPSAVKRRLLSEAIGRGILPTIGMKAWNKKGPVEIPSRPDPGQRGFIWDDLGVCHSWESHLRHTEHCSTETERQVCIYADWFPGIHLIAVSQFVLGEFGIESAPARIEGKEVGFIIQSGGTISYLEGMRPIHSNRLTDRIDFVAGFRKNIQAVQYLMFAGLSANFSERYSRSESVSASIWKEFQSECRIILTSFDLGELAENEWYLKAGWRSIRYQIRHERPHRELLPGLQAFIRVLRSRHGVALKRRIGRLTGEAVATLHKALWEEGTERIQPLLLRILSVHDGKVQKGGVR